MRCDPCGVCPDCRAAADALPRTCPTHGIPLVAYCPACRGAKGGQVTSEAKRAAAQQNVAKARAAKARPP